MFSFEDNLELAEEQVAALIFLLTAVAHVDGEFHYDEQRFIRRYIEEVVERRVAAGGDLAETRRRYHGIFHVAARYIDDLWDEVLSEGEKSEDFVGKRLRLHGAELLALFDEEEQDEVLEVVDELVCADGVEHPAEIAFCADVLRMVRARPPEPAEDEEVPSTTLAFTRPRKQQFEAESHPILDEVERNYSRDPEEQAQQAAFDAELAERAVTILDRQRARGADRLKGHPTLGSLPAPDAFLDDHVAVIQPEHGKRYEFLVLGDLHGCYSCLKAALMQANFLDRAMAYLKDPTRNPDLRLVLLGDYVDRGFYSVEGVLRTLLTLYTSMPSRVVALRGNHEFYLKKDGKILPCVRPAEAIQQWLRPETQVQFDMYQRLFTKLPSALLFDRMVFVHAGIPRDETMRTLWKDLSSLNEYKVRFEMMWSDPCAVDYVPEQDQAENVRFSFGRSQFRHFMSTIGANTLIRGHQQVEEGFRDDTEDDGLRLVTLFSAGGRNNPDLPRDSAYRRVTPMALTVTWEDGVSEATPWEIDYDAYSTPQLNGLLTEPTTRWPWD